MPREPRPPSQPGTSLADTELPGGGLARGSQVHETPADVMAATADAAHTDGVAPQRISTVGRFTVLGSLGRGGMGEVHAAYDPELDRKVALKLLRGGGEGSSAGEARSRLLREARAMARLSHPNAITVFEAGQVEVGGEPQVYVAMELIEGGTLGRWLRSERRSWREVLPLMISAGRGLGAAHTAGMVHRDFKPDNVLVSDRGEVKVTDFGLAALVAVAEVIDPEDPLSGSGSGPGEGTGKGKGTGTGRGSERLDRLTRTGAWVGTPYYMAPEQHRGDGLDARSDQFSFCVTLWEALFGERPFTGRTYDELRRSVDAGTIRTPRRDSPVPGWLERAIRRGLAVSPADRHPSMATLLDLLERGLHRRRRALLLAGGVAALAAAGAVGLTFAMAAGGENEAAPCSGAERHLDGTWDDPVRARVRAGLERAQPALAADSWPRVERSLDGYAVAWAQAHRQACEATRVYREQTEEELDLRMRCLDRRRDELAATTGLLAAADEGVAARAVAIAGALPSPDGCRDPETLRIGVALDDAGQARAAAIERRLAELRVAFRAGRYAETLAPTRALLAEARELGHRPLEAEVLFHLAELQMRDRTDSKESGDTYHAAAAAAIAAGQDRLAARAWAGLVYVLSDHDQYAEATRVAELARSTLARMGGDPQVESMLDNNLGVVEQEAGHLDQAQKLFERAIAARIRVLGPDDPRVAAPIDNLATVVGDRGDDSGAMALYERALAIRERGLGPNHPEVATTLNNLGIGYRHAGRIDESRAALERALRIRETALGAGHALVGNTLVNLTATHAAAGDWDRCVATGERAAALYRAKSASMVGMGHALFDVARCHRLAGRPAAGLPVIDRAITTYLLFKDGQSWSRERAARRERARLLAAAGRRGEAIAALRKQMADEDRLLEPDDAERTSTTAELGLQLIEAGQARRGVPLLERAVSSWSGPGGPSGIEGRYRLALARALWTQGRRERAIELGRRALADFADGDAESVPGRVAAREWLAARQP